MKRIAIGVAALVATISLSSCSTFEGTLGKTYDSFEDEHGRNCTALKWGESSSLDCDYPPVPTR